MKKLIRMLSTILASVFLLCSVVGCAFDRTPKLPKLNEPTVTIDADGVATWNSVENALYYIYVIDEGEENLTIECSVQLVSNQSIKVKAVSGIEDYADSDFSNYKTYIKNTVQKIKLATPQVTVSEDGVATWNEIANAEYYVYMLNGLAEVSTTQRSVTLANGQTFKVKAVSDDDDYSDSDYSQLKTYVNGSVVTKLNAPQVSVDADGIATWNSITGAQYYVYVIDNGAEINTSTRSVTLTNGQSIKVKSCSDADNYENSEYSLSVTYTDNKPIGGHTHADANSDKLCDICGKSVMAELSFLAVNDLHGKFIDTDSQPGVDEFTTYLKNLYADKTREEVLLSSGDMWQGTVESSTNKGKLMTEWMNEVGFVSMTLGNHEYDWGSAVLTPNSKLAEFPFLAINITYNGKKVDYCQPSTVVEKGGIKIGIIGAIGDCLSSISGDFKTGLSFATGDALTSLVKTEADRLRNSEGCEFIVYSIHEGYGSETTSISDYYDESLSDGYVDLVFEGHTHQNYIKKDDYGVYHLQGGGENKYVSQADVSYNTVTKQYTVTPRTLAQNVYANSSLKDDPVVQQIFNKYFPDGNPYTTVLGNIKSQKSSDAIYDDVSRLYYEKGVELWGSEYNIVLGGGFLRLRSPYKVSAGNVTYASLFSILPFDNDIVLGRIQGTYLKSKFLETSNADYHIYSTISSSNVSNNSYYYIIVDSYTSTFTSNRITEVKRWNSEKYARDLLADYVKTGGWA
ncbi:MAG: metallophosphoesterase [Clostridiales bacterium]|nr:metallophosphoesterase [Clostridiales bacterium]